MAIFIVIRNKDALIGRLEHPTLRRGSTHLLCSFSPESREIGMGIDGIGAYFGNSDRDSGDKLSVLSCVAPLCRCPFFCFLVRGHILLLKCKL